MSVSAIGSTALAQDFASLSPQQLLNPNGQLFSASLTANQEGLTGSSHSHGSHSSSSAPVSSTSGQNYLQTLQGFSGSNGLNNLSSADQSQILGQEGLTQALSAYQDPLDPSGSQGANSGGLFDADI
jgi:hypothetical protein